MIALTVHMEFVTTGTEAEALLLEANLIKKLKPRYQRGAARRQVVSLYPDRQGSCRCAAGEASRRRNRKGSYFGPFASAGSVNRAINTLQKAFLLRTCTDSTYENRTRPCLLYQIKRCAAPCVGLYRAVQPMTNWSGEAEAFLAARARR